MSVLFTLDLEDHTGAYAQGGRYVGNTHRILDLCDQAGLRGTVFVVGRVAEAAPNLVAEVARRGHEIACHSHAHTPLEQLGAAGFRQDSARAKALLEDVSGQEVRGYRAPVFSLVRSTPWAPDVLAELGFSYSSSVMPAANPLHGFPGAPATPFRWPSGLVECPCPVARLGPVTVPYLGGIYLRYLPLATIRALGRRGAVGLRWTYCHPYDFDAGEPYVRIAGAGHAVSVLLWLNRRGTARKIAAMATGKAGTMAEAVARLEGLPTWPPTAN